MPTNGASVVFASWEDEPEEFYRRLQQISGQAAPWVTPERLQGLRIVNLVGEGPIWAPEPGRHISTMAAITATGERRRRLCEYANARLLVLDPLAAAYASDENARGLVRAFVSHWDAWGQANNCTVLMLAHPPKSAGVDYAGSTDWQGAARALWTLRSESGKSLEAGPTIWKLEFVKGNYGPRPEPLQLHWDTGGVGLRWEVFGQAVRETADGGMKLTTESTLAEMATAILGALPILKPSCRRWTGPFPMLPNKPTRYSHREAETVRQEKYYLNGSTTAIARRMRSTPPAAG